MVPTCSVCRTDILYVKNSMQAGWDKSGAAVETDKLSSYGLFELADSSPIRPTSTRLDLPIDLPVSL